MLPCNKPRRATVPTNRGHRSPEQALSPLAGVLDFIVMVSPELRNHEQQW